MSREIRRIFWAFQDLYHFQTEVWDINDVACHAEVNQKILDFSRLGGDSKEDLEIVYYAGHGKLTQNRLLSSTRRELIHIIDCCVILPLSKLILDV